MVMVGLPGRDEATKVKGPYDGSSGIGTEKPYRMIKCTLAVDPDC